MSKEKDSSIGWMYDGAKGNVHREDYLLGKKVDKNFEKYSDVVNVQKAEAIDSIVGKRTVFNSGPSTGLKTSSLQKDIIKSEDPLVAVKVREETKRRELMDNPFMKMRLQNMLKTMMTSKNEKKKEKKSKKDKKKKKKKRSRSSSSSDSDNEGEKSRKDQRSPTPKRKRKTSERSEEPRSIRRKESSGDHRMSRRSRSPSVEKRRSNYQQSRSLKRDRSRSLERGSPRKNRSRSKSTEKKRRESKSPRRKSPRNEETHRVRKEERKERQISRSRSPSRSADKPTSSSSRQYDSHVPHHLKKRHDSSSSDSEANGHRRNKRENDEEKNDGLKKSYGLVEMRKRTDEEKEEEANAPRKEYKLIKISTGRGSSDRQREPRRVLTDEEKAARLAEMKDNVKWRDEVREKNVIKGKVEDDEEKDEADKNGYAPSFIRSQMREACDDMTVEKRLQSNKRGVQRSHGYMDRSFARK